MKHTVKRVKSKQLGHMNVIGKLVKEVETLISERNDFSKKTISRVRAAKKKLIESRVAMEKLDEEMDEALAEEGDIEDEAVTENIERCQEILMHLEESLFDIEEYEEEVERRKGQTVREEQQRAVNMVSTTSDQEQADLAVVERVNVAAENFLSYRISGTEAAFREDSVNPAVAEDQSGGRRNVSTIDEEQQSTSPDLRSFEGGDVMASVFGHFDSLGTSTLNTLELQTGAQSQLWKNTVLLNEDFNRGADFGGNSVWSSSKPSTGGEKNRGPSMNSEKTQRKSHHFEQDEGDVDSGRRAGAEVGGQRDGDVVVGGRRVGDVGVVGVRRVGDVGVVGDWRAGDLGINAVRGHSKKITDTTQNKSGKTKRGKTAVMFSSDKEDKKRKTKLRKRKDEDEEDDGSQEEEEDEEEEDEEEEDEEDKEEREEQKEMKQMKKLEKVLKARQCKTKLNCQNSTEQSLSG